MKISNSLSQINQTTENVCPLKGSGSSSKAKKTLKFFRSKAFGKGFSKAKQSREGFGFFCFFEVWSLWTTITIYIFLWSCFCERPIKPTWNFAFKVWIFYAMICSVKQSVSPTINGSDLLLREKSYPARLVLQLVPALRKPKRLGLVSVSRPLHVNSVEKLSFGSVRYRGLSVWGIWILSISLWREMERYQSGIRLIWEREFEIFIWVWWVRVWKRV